MDVLWFRVPRREVDSEAFGHIEAGAMMIMLNRAITGNALMLFRKAGSIG